MTALWAILAVAAQDPDLDALVKRWADARFFINEGVYRAGWQRYQTKWGEFEGEKAIVVEFERATKMFWADRFTAWLRPDATLSPLAVRWGNTWHTRKFPKDSGGLCLFPEMLTSLIPLKEEGETSFKQVSPHASEPEAGKLTIKGKDEGKWTIAMSTKVRRYEDPESWETEIVLRQDRTLQQLFSRVSYTTSFDGKKHRHPEKLYWTFPEEWKDGTALENESWIGAQLALLVDLNNVLRANDLDENGSNDCWTGDVSGLYRLIPPKRKEPIALIAREVAAADAAPLPAGPEKGGGRMGEPLAPKPVPWHGYYFKVLLKTSEGDAFNDGSNHHPNNFGVCAYPADYPNSGRNTYVMTAYSDPIWKDLKGQPATELPANSKGWNWMGSRR